MSAQPQAPKPRLSIWERLLKINRQVIFLFLAVIVAIPLFKPMQIKPLPMEPVQALFNTVDSIPPEKALVISVDYDPSTEAELQPMLIAFMRHAFAHHIKLGVLALPIQGVALGQEALSQVVAEFNARARTPQESLRYGQDYVLWGFQPNTLMVLVGMGEDISKVFRTDAFGHQTESLPIMEGLRNYANIGAVISVSGSTTPLWWVTYAQTQFGVKVGAAVTAVSAPDDYPFFSKTRQLSGILAGMKGGAEYEEMVEERYPQSAVGVPEPGTEVATPEGKGKVDKVDVAGGTALIRLATGQVSVPLGQVEFVERRRATEAMSSQTFAHYGIMLLIIIGNVAFFATRRRKK
jgi:hypothetical protein